MTTMTVQGSLVSHDGKYLAASNEKERKNGVRYSPFLSVSPCWVVKTPVPGKPELIRIASMCGDILGFLTNPENKDVPCFSIHEGASLHAAWKVEGKPEGGFALRWAPTGGNEKAGAESPPRYLAINPSTGATCISNEPYTWRS
jgi:hypothetical protein